MSAALGSDADRPADELPPGWAWVPVEGLAANETGALTDGPFGSNLKTSHYKESGPRVIRLQNIGDGVFYDEQAHITREHFEQLRKHEAKGQDVLVAMLGEKLPRACLVPDHVGPAIVKADCARLRVDPELALPGLVATGLNSPSLRRQADELVHGVGRPRLGLRWLKTLQFPLAPLPEQHRLVEAIESYFTRLDDAVATLERVQRNLKRYRAAVLKAAVEGRLVPTEAELARAEGRDYEPASALLEHILAERRRRWHEAGGRGVYHKPVAPDTTDLPELAEGWCWATWFQIGLSQNGRAFPSKEYREEGARLLRPGNLHSSGRVDWTAKNTQHMPEKWAGEFPGFLVGPDELVMNLTAQSLADDFLGRICITGPGERCLLNQRIARLTPILVDARFVLWLFKASRFRRFVSSLNTGSLIQHMFTSQLATFVLPLPPAAEQVRIAAEVERHMSLSDGIDTDIEHDLGRCARLRQSILKWAFEGRLADQNPSDEPASALLERIRSQTSASRQSASDPGDRRRGRRGRRGRRSPIRAENNP